MKPNTIRECRWGLHLDNNNAVNNPDENGWVVRVWLELTDDDSSALVVRKAQFDKRSEVSIALPRHQQAVVDSEYLYHGGYHHGPGIRYALIVSCEEAAPRWRSGSTARRPSWLGSIGRPKRPRWTTRTVLAAAAVGLEQTREGSPPRGAAPRRLGARELIRVGHGRRAPESSRSGGRAGADRAPISRSRRSHLPDVGKRGAAPADADRDDWSASTRAARATSASRVTSTASARCSSPRSRPAAAPCPREPAAIGAVPLQRHARRRGKSSARR